MCGRIRQKGDEPDYFSFTKWNPLKGFAPEYQPSPNVPPGKRPLVMHRLGDGTEQADCLHWMYAPSWYDGKPTPNARLDTLLANSNFWRAAKGRVIVPCDGWYEWTGEKPNKQPWYISPKDNKPLFMAAVTAWRPGEDHDVVHGMAIVTDQSAGGMVDVHDRRPIVLTADNALEWLDPSVPFDQAKQILSAARPESAFHWWQVTRAMGNWRYQLNDASEPIDV